MKLLSISCSCLILLSASLWADEPHWPQFRGPRGDGVAPEANAPQTWSASESIFWKAEVPGKGWSSPVVWGGRVFVTTAVSDAAGREPRKGLYVTDLLGAVPEGEHRWLVLCLDLRTGKLLWEREAHRGRPEHRIHLKNSYASETPVTDGERVYAWFGNVGLFCCDLDGKPLWERRWPPVKTRLGWGTGASPALQKGRLYLVNDNEGASFILCLDAATGEEIWRTDRDEASNWSTPFVWENERRTEIVTAGSGKVRSYSLEGEVLWTLSGMSMITIPTPFAADGLLYVTSGYVADPRRPLYAIRPGASGDISLQGDETENEFIAWHQPQAGPYHPSPIVVDDLLYVLYDRGMLACYEAKTGREVYGRQRLGAAAFTASPWSYQGKVFCLNEDGETVVIQAGRQFEIVGRNRLDDMSMATPAVAGDRLLLRTLSSLYCIGRE